MSTRRHARRGDVRGALGSRRSRSKWVAPASGRNGSARRKCRPPHCPSNIVKPHVSAKPWLQRSATRRPSESGASRPASLARRRRRGDRSRHASMLPAWRRRQVPARAGRNRRLRLEGLDRSSATRNRRPSGALSPRHDGRCLAARQLDADGSLASPVPTRHLRVGFSVSGFLPRDG